MKKIENLSIETTYRVRVPRVAKKHLHAAAPINVMVDSPPPAALYCCLLLQAILVVPLSEKRLFCVTAIIKSEIIFI